MSRVQLALNVSDIDEAVEFYSKLFGTEPAKVRPGYANFAIADPPLKLVLIEDPTTRPAGCAQPPRRRGREHRRGGRRPGPAGERRLETEVEDQTTCCYAVQDKVWVNDPDGALGGLHRPGRRRDAGRACCAADDEQACPLPQ